MFTPTAPAIPPSVHLTDLHRYNTIRDHIETVGSMVNIASAAARALDSEVADTMTPEQKTLVIERVWGEVMHAVSSFTR